MVMRGSAVRLALGVRWLSATFLIALLPACDAQMRFDGLDSVPADSSLVGRPMPSGGTGAGNYLAGRFAQNQNDLASASTYLQRALAVDPENIELLQRTYLSLAADGQLKDAAAVAARLLKFDGEAAVAALLVAEQQGKAGNWSGVEATISSLPKRGLNTFMMPLIIGWAKAGQGNFDAALEAFAPLAQNSGYAALHDFHAALVDDLADRRKAAEQDYRNTLAGAGGATLRTTEAAVAFYRRIGQTDKAEEVLTRYRQNHPESTMFGDSHISGRAVDSAAAGMAEALFDAAGSLRQGRASELALIFARMAIDLHPDFPLAQVMVADLLQGLGHLRDANAIFQEISSSSPVYWSAQLRIAANDDDLDDVDAATRTLEALAAQYPDRPEALVTLGDIYRRHKRWTDAVSAYDRALGAQSSAISQHWDIYYSRGIALERSQQWIRAESDFLHALELEPDEPHVLNYLGYSWIEQGVNVEKAREMIEKAVAQLPKDGYIVDSLGWAFFRSGDYGKAVEVLDRAVEMHPEDAAINDHLGDALWKVGREEEARFQWQRALISDPDPELKQEIERKLTSGLQDALATPVQMPAQKQAPAPKLTTKP
jgi:tetratricopeptide (TPR) repeat protein